MQARAVARLGRNDVALGSGAVPQIGPIRRHTATTPTAKPSSFDDKSGSLADFVDKDCHGSGI
jgi:hypothetical protein